MPFDYESSHSRAFKNYMMGQSIIFFNYSFNQDSEIFLTLITNELKRKDTLSDNDTVRIREFFDLYLEKLKEQNLISKNNMGTYKEIVPFFEAFYVFYEKELEYENIKALINKVFGKKNED